MGDSFRGYIVDELQLRESFKFRTNSSLHLQIAWQNVTDLLGLPYQSGVMIGLPIRRSRGLVSSIT